MVNLKKLLNTHNLFFSWNMIYNKIIFIFVNIFYEKVFVKIFYSRPMPIASTSKSNPDSISFYRNHFQLQILGK